MIDPAIAALRTKVTVTLVQHWPHTLSEMEVELEDGRRLSTRHDVGMPAASSKEQGTRLESKFLGLAAPVLGERQALRLMSAVLWLDQLSSVFVLTQFFAPHSH